jgi:hypothetical protein
MVAPLKEAADELVGRVLDAALVARGEGVTFAPVRLIEFLAEVADLSARGTRTPSAGTAPLRRADRGRIDGALGAAERERDRSRRDALRADQIARDRRSTFTMMFCGQFTVALGMPWAASCFSTAASATSPGTWTDLGFSS